MNRIRSSISTNSSTRSTMPSGPSAKSSISRLQRTNSRPMSPASTASLSEFTTCRPPYSAPKEPIETLDSCEYDAEMEALAEDEFLFIEMSDDIPTQSQLEAARDIKVYDAEGNSRPFKSLYVGEEHMGQRQLVIFVRHFYCGACQLYLKALTSTFTPNAYFSLPIPTQITIIGCGAPSLIPRYIARTNCPFRVYAEPSRKLYKALGMSMTVKVGRPPEYTGPISAPKLVMDSFVQMGFSPRNQMFKGGNMIQTGGEFLFEDSRPIWCHRMRNVRDHSEMKILKRVLEMSDAAEDDGAQETDAEELREQERQRAPSQVIATTSSSSHAKPERNLRKKMSRQRTKSEPDEEDATLTALPLSARVSVSLARREAYSSHASNRSSIAVLTAPNTPPGGVFQGGGNVSGAKVGGGSGGRGLKVIWDGKGQAHLGRESRMGLI